jgi:hypothetical protein
MENHDSILNTIKKLLGMPNEYEPFDEDIKIHINSVFATLAQIGVCPNEDGFQIEGPDDKWSDFTNDDKLINNVRSYMYLKVKLLFDPPANSVLVDSIERQIKELEYRLYTQRGGY